MIFFTQRCNPEIIAALNPEPGDQTLTGRNLLPDPSGSARPDTKGAATFQNLGVCIFPSCLCKRSTTAVKRRWGKRNWEGVSPSPADWGSGERRKVPQRGLGQPQTILGRFMYNFTGFHASFGAFNSWMEMGDSYIPLYWLVGTMFPFNFFWGVGGWRTPTTPTAAVGHWSDQCQLIADLIRSHVCACLSTYEHPAIKTFYARRGAVVIRRITTATGFSLGYMPISGFIARIRRTNHIGVGVQSTVGRQDFFGRKLCMKN